MNNLIISKKGKAPAAFSLVGALVLVLAVLSIYTSFDPSFGSEIEIHEIMSFAAPLTLAVVTFVLFTSASKHNKAYIKVYTDRIEGYGVCGRCGTRAQNFSFSSHDSYTVTREGTFVCVNCNGNSYYINLSPAAAEAVYSAATAKNTAPSVVEKDA